MQNRKIFFKYVIPSVLAFALSGIYTIVDKLFIGHSLGGAGSAAINLGYPIAGFIQAAGTGIGLAGGIRVTILHAYGAQKEKQECFFASLLLLFIACAVLTGLFMLFSQPVLRLLGADGESLILANDYTKIIVLGVFFRYSLPASYRLSVIWSAPGSPWRQ